MEMPPPAKFDLPISCGSGIADGALRRFLTAAGAALLREGSNPVKTADWLRRLPWSIVAAAVLLIGLGWLGIARVEELTEGSGRFLHQQMAYSVIALVAMLLMTIFNYRCSCRFSYALFLLGDRPAGGGVLLPGRSMARIGGFAWDRSGSSLRIWPRWRSCWRWPGT